MKNILSRSTVKEYKKDRIIHLQNEKCHRIDIILNGRVSVQNIDENGNVLTINVFAENDIIGANLIFSKRNEYPMDYNAKTITLKKLLYLY